MTEHPIIAFIHPQLLKSNPLSQIVTSNPSLQPDTHFAVDMFPYKRTSFFRSPASNPKLRKSPEIRRFLELDFIFLTSVLLSQRYYRFPTKVSLSPVRHDKSEN